MKQFKNILVAVNAEAPDRFVIQQAMELADENQAAIKLVDVVREFGWFARMATPKHQEVQQKITTEKTKRLEELAEPARGKGIETSTAVLHGKTSVAIVREVLQGAHDLVIKPAKGASWFKGFFGETGLQLMRNCPCPVWLTKPGTDAPCKQVMAAVDASFADEAHAALNRKIMSLATGYCRWEGAELNVVQSWNVFGEDVLSHHMPLEEFKELMQKSEAESAQCFDEFLSQYKLDCKSPNVHLLHGEPGRVIPQFAESKQIDLIVMGTIARGGLAGALMGNTAEAILAQVNCAVLSVKPDDFVPPIRVEN